MSRAKFQQIADKIAAQIESGQYAEGEKLPAHRVLAEQNLTTPVTIAKAYKVLADQGKIESHVGRGSFVSARSHLSQVIQTEREQDALNFSILQPCYAEHLDALHQQLQNSYQPLRHADIFGYLDHSGLAEHRQAGAVWMSEFGLEQVHEDNVLLTNGAQHALSMLVQLFSQPGDHIAVEAFTYPGILSIIQDLGRTAVPVSLDEEGVIPDALAEVCHEWHPALIIVIPSHQNPTGATMSAQRRQQIAAVVQQYDAYLIEDDIYSFLNDEKLAPITNYLPEKSFYLSSLSKAISPGMRCGYLKVPNHLVGQVERFIRSSIWLPSPIVFEFAHQLISSGMGFDMANTQREIARRRHKLAKEILAKTTLTAQPTSFQLWITLPAHLSADRFTKRAQQEKVLVSSGNYFSTSHKISPSSHQHIRVSLMSIVDEQHFQHGLSVLARLLSSYQ